MYAILRQFRYDPGKLVNRPQVLAKTEALHASQPGYEGSLVIDDGQRLIALNLWETAQAAAAGREAIGDHVQRLLQPLMAGPPELIAAGELLANDREERS